MEIEPYINTSLEEYNDILIYKIVVVNVKLTQLKWIDTINRIKKDLDVLKKKDKIFAIYIDCKYMEIISNGQIKEIVNVFTENRVLFEKNLLCTECFVEGIIVNVFKDVFNKIYNPIRPIKFIKTNELDYSFIEENIK
jgi:hypothetical protein